MSNPQFPKLPVDVSQSARFSSRAVYFSSLGHFNPWTIPGFQNNSFMCFSYNKPYNAAYKPGSGMGSVGTVSSTSRAKRNRV